jgi:hypothetical protein
MKRVLLVCVFVVSFAAIASAQTTFYYPHVANGVLGGTVWKTTIFLTNPAAVNTATASGSITFFRDNSNPAAAGSAFNISVVDDAGNPVGSGNTVPFQIAGGQTRKFVTTGSGAYAGGFAVVSSNVAVTGTSIFSQFDLANRLIGEAGVPAASAVPRQAIFVDTLGGYNIGVAFANAEPTTASVTLSLLNTSAQTVATTTTTLGANNHRAAFVTELFPPSTPQLAGTMQIIGSGPLSAVALRFDPSFSVFTTLPPVTIASMLEPAVKWFQQRPWAAPVMSLARLVAAFQYHLG